MPGTPVVSGVSGEAVEQAPFHPVSTPPRPKSLQRAPGSFSSVCARLASLSGGLFTL